MLLVWISTKKSILNREISFLAILELLIVNIFYLWVTLKYDIYMHILISILFTPLLLLKSTKSIKFSLFLFYCNFKNLAKGKYTKNKLYLYMFFLALLYAGLASNNLYIILTLSILLCIFFIKKTLEKTQMRIVFESAFLISTYYFFTYIVSFYKLVEEDYSSIFFQIVILIFSFIFAGIFSLVFLAAFLFILSILIVKFVSTFKYFNLGINNLTSNWYENIFIIDSFKTPEILLGVEEDKRINSIFKYSEYKKFLNYYKSFSYFFNEFKDFANKESIPQKSKKELFFVNYLNLFMHLIIQSFLQIYAIVFLIFSLLLRFSIKSTFWFYLPLLFLVKTPSSLKNNSKNIGEFLSSLYETYFAKWRFLLAVFALGGFIYSFFDSSGFSELNTSFSQFLIFLYIDISSLEIWRIFQLSIIISTIIIFFMANNIRVTKINNSLTLEKSNSVLFIFYLNTFRNWVSFFYFCSAFIYISFYYKFWENEFIPLGIKSFFIILRDFIIYMPFS